jgi:TatD DNase family protein
LLPPPPPPQQQLIHHPYHWHKQQPRLSLLLYRSIGDITDRKYFERYPIDREVHPTDDPNQHNNSNNNNNDTDFPTSLEDIPHWTKRPIAKQQQIQRKKVAQVDYETYWKRAFEIKDDQYYREYFNKGFVARGEIAFDIPVQYPKDPTFLPRQWSSSSTISSSINSKNENRVNCTTASTGTSNSNNGIKHDEGSNDTSNSVMEGNTDINLHSKTTEVEEPTERKLRIVDVDCNLWHKDLLQLLLPKLPNESADTTSFTSNDDTSISESKKTNSTLHDVDIPDCLQILRNDDLASVVAMITPSSTIAEAAKGLDVLKQMGDGHDPVSHIPNHIRLRTTVGVHPYHVPDPFHNYHDSTEDNNNNDDEAHWAIKDVASTMAKAKLLLDDPSHRNWICAIGECGLDTTTGFPPIAYQIPYFIAQIELANEYQLPLFLHERNAHEPLIDLLNEYVDPDRIPNIIIHCFTGNVLHCETYINRGYYISLSGFVFRENEALQVQTCLEHNMIPLDRLMIETDSPYMGFTGCRELFIEKNRQAVNAPFLTSKQRKVYSIKQNYPNPPSSIIMVLHQILHHINIGRRKRNEPLLTVQELADATTRNANTFFGLGL